MKTIDFSYFIERYIAGEMNETEKKWFQKELDGNEMLKREVALRKSTESILKDQNVISLRNKLSEIEKRRKAEIPARHIKKHNTLRYAAAVTGLIIVGSFVLLPDRNLNSDEIMNRFYKTYEPTEGQRSAQIGTNTDLTLAMEYYNAHDFENAAILFSKVLANNPKDMQSTLLNGIANFENKEYPAAKKSFGNVINDNNNLYIDQAEWYLALCYLNTGEKDKAKQLFEIIKNGNSIYSKDARKILRKTE